MDRGAWQSMRSQSRTQLSTTTHDSSEVNTGKLYFLKKLPILSQVFKFTFKEVNKVTRHDYFYSHWSFLYRFLCCESGFLLCVSSRRLPEVCTLWKNKSLVLLLFPFSVFQLINFCFYLSEFSLSAFLQKQVVLLYSLELDVCFIYSHSFLGFSLYSDQWREESPKVSCSPWGCWLLSPPAHNLLIRNVEVEREVNFREGLAGRGESAPWTQMARWQDTFSHHL